jgi:hypothetical protein
VTVRRNSRSRGRLCGLPALGLYSVYDLESVDDVERSTFGAGRRSAQAIVFSQMYRSSPEL